MILIDGYWETVRDLQDVSRIIREYYNNELADELDNLIPEHTDDDYYSLESEVSKLEDELAEKDDEISDLKDQITDLKDRIEKSENT